MATRYVLVDFENVQPRKIAALNGSSAYKVKVFLGASQTKLPVDMALALQRLGSDAEYIRIDGNGSNALDFHIAFYIGRLAAATPDAEFEIVSKDKGFDPLIRHLGGLGIRCRRSESISGVRAGAAAKGAAVPDPVESAIENLHKRKTAKPRTLKTLRTSLDALFASKLGRTRSKSSSGNWRGAASSGWSTARSNTSCRCSRDGRNRMRPAR